jgi:hypothetical protein
LAKRVTQAAFRCSSFLKKKDLLKILYAIDKLHKDWRMLLFVLFLHHKKGNDEADAAEQKHH